MDAKCAYYVAYDSIRGVYVVRKLVTDHNHPHGNYVFDAYSSERRLSPQVHVLTKYFHKDIHYVVIGIKTYCNHIALSVAYRALITHDNWNLR